MRKYRFWLDTETTGIKPEINQILEYAVIVEDDAGNKIEELEVKLTLRPFVRPEKGALEVNKINPYSQEWNDSAVSEYVAAEKLAKLCKKYTVGNNKPTIVAYNADFDISHIKVMLLRHGILFQKYFNQTYFDPLKTVKSAVSSGLINTKEITKGKKTYRSSKLGDVAESLNLNTEKPAHRALNDVETLIKVTREVYKKITSKNFLESSSSPEKYVFGEVYNLVNETSGGLKISHVKVLKNFLEQRKVLVFDLSEYSRIGLAPSNVRLIDYSMIIDELDIVKNEHDKLDEIFSSNIDFIQTKIKETVV